MSTKDKALTALVEFIQDLVIAFHAACPSGFCLKFGPPGEADEEAVDCAFGGQE